jgi:hypothetical protein
MDPNSTDLALIQTMVMATDWCGITQPQWEDAQQVLGDIKLMREVALIDGPDWTAAVLTIQITTTAATDTLAAVTRGISLAERGRFKSLRRVCLLVSGRDPDEPGATSAVAQATSTVAGAAPIARTEGISMSSILDQISSTKIELLDPIKLRAMYSDYAVVYGSFPSADCDPTVEQVSALAQVIKGGGSPWADFAIFGPHGKRILKKLTFTGWAPGPEGTLIKKELAGPPTIIVWRKCWRTFRTVALLLKVASPEALDGYQALVSGLGEQYPSLWWLVYQADYRMRSEFWDRILMEVEHKRASLSSIDPIVAQTLVPFNPNMPWDAIIRASTSQDYAYFWNQEVREKAVDLKTHSATLYDLKTDSETIELVAASDKAMPWMRGGSNKRSTDSGGGAPSHTGKKEKKGGNKSSACPAFNSTSGCCKNESDCPQGLSHVCGTCGTRSHGEAVCWSKHPHLRPGDKPQNKGGKGGKGKGGKNRKG